MSGVDKNPLEIPDSRSKTRSLGPATYLINSNSVCRQQLNVKEDAES